MGLPHLNHSKITKKELASIIDHTLLKPTATKNDIIRLCEDARKYNFAAVCVNPIYVPLVAELLMDKEIKPCTVVGFPLGANSTRTKSFEAEEAIQNGAKEIDMVMNVGALKSGDSEFVKGDIEGVINVAKPKNVIVKVIIETCYLTDKEKVEASKIVKEAKADYIKTSTGFGPKGATVYDVKLIKHVVGDGMGIKASGGIRTYKKAVALVKAGATRIGTSSGAAIMED